MGDVFDESMSYWGRNPTPSFRDPFLGHEWDMKIKWNFCLYWP